jgi:hypothetical protein
MSRQRYWAARQKYSTYLLANDRDLWRLLMPCDPVVTVADDVVFYECFSADESSYGCLTVARDAFGTTGDIQLGTTNVDYSWELYQHFQQLRTYRETRFRVGATGIGVQTANAEDYFEEKIDLPEGWFARVPAGAGFNEHAHAPGACFAGCRLCAALALASAQGAH